MIRKEKRKYSTYYVVTMFSKEEPPQMFANMQVEKVLGGYMVTVEVKDKRRAEEIEKMLKEAINE